jgi:hydroxymethylglutaryl-CoA lyase
MKIIECPRDAIQGIKINIPTEEKVSYINTLLQVGFDTIDFGSFVSPKVIPQMADTEQVLEQLDFGKSKSKLLAIIANVRGAEIAAKHIAIQYLGFPFSISETFQRRNTNSNISSALNQVKDIQNICTKRGKELVIYISMAFGNPYNDPYNQDEVLKWIDTIEKEGVKIFSLADTVALASPNEIYTLIKSTLSNFKQIELGAHLHSTYVDSIEKIEAVIEAGCTRIDGALKGYGGCPMAKDELIGNIPTEVILTTLKKHNLTTNVNNDALTKALNLADKIFQHE